jgi:hypothetical protein
MLRIKTGSAIAPMGSAGAIATAALASAISLAAASDSGWMVQFGTAAVDNANGLAVAGNDVYVAGATSGLLGESSAGLQDIYLRSYDRDGNLQWTRQFGTPGADQTTGGTLRARGNVVVVAGIVRGGLPGYTWAGNNDAFVRAYDRQGNFMWDLQLGTPQNEAVRSVAIAEDGSIFISGQTLGQLTDQPNQGLADAYVARINRDGTMAWLRQFGTSGTDEAIGITVSGDAFFVSGTTSGTLPGSVNAGDFDNFIARLTLDGDFEWITQFGTPAFDALWKIGVVGSTVFVGGNTQGEFPGQVASGGFDAVVAATDTSGVVQWVRQFGTTGNDLALGLGVDDRGAVAVGRVGGFLAPGLPDPGSDAFALKYDAEGNVLWSIQFGTSSFDNAQDVALKAGDVYVAGTTLGSMPGYSNAGLQDGFVSRMAVKRQD